MAAPLPQENVHFQSLFMILTASRLTIRYVLWHTDLTLFHIQSFSGQAADGYQKEKDLF
jgi:hypothetical protein